MQLYFDNIYGYQTNGDLLFNVVSAHFEKNEYNYAFENGWSPINFWYDGSSDLIWYQSRNTRIDLHKHYSSKKTRQFIRNSPVSYKIVTNYTYSTEIYKIYKNYCIHKDFTDIASYSEIETIFKYPLDQQFVLFYYESTLIAVTKISIWSNSLYSEFFWWNYDMPELNVGKISSEAEIEFAKSTGNRFLYTGLGYHSHGVYKSLKKGFEWWTGREWSTDIEKYKYLCKKDDQIKTIEELQTHQLEYFKDKNELPKS